MNYFDEKIIPIKMEQKQTITMSIENGYYINGKLQTFVRKELYDSFLSVFLPEKFIDMPQQIKELKYPSSFRPTIIKTNIDNSVNFAFNLFDSLDDLSGSTGQIVNNFIAVLKQTNPSISVHEVNSEMIRDNEITFLDFTSFGFDQRLYNLMCFIVISGKVVQGIFNCLERDKEDWKTAAKEVFLTYDWSRHGSDQ